MAVRKVECEECGEFEVSGSDEEIRDAVILHVIMVHGNIGEIEEHGYPAPQSYSR